MLATQLRMLLSSWAVVGHLGCGGVSLDDGRGEASSGSTTAGVTSLAVDASTSESSGSSTAGSTAAVFVTPHDHAGVLYECSIYTQDCPAGEKCMPWANDGGSSWNARKCTPIADDPVEVGEPCHAEGSGFSGVDDCELGAMCWDVDYDTLEGVCVAMCMGSEEHAFCADPDEFCAMSSDATFTLCLPTCDPVEPNCLVDQACVPIGPNWSCAPDASGDAGAYGDECEFINVCDPGLICLDASTVPPGLPCEGGAGCCTEVCDVTDPLGDAQCTGAAGGQTCQPWYEDGDAPPDLENVGACALP